MSMVQIMNKRFSTIKSNFILIAVSELVLIWIIITNYTGVIRYVSIVQLQFAKNMQAKQTKSCTCIMTKFSCRSSRWSLGFCRILRLFILYTQRQFREFIRKKRSKKISIINIYRLVIMQATRSSNNIRQLFITGIQSLLQKIIIPNVQINMVRLITDKKNSWLIAYLRT